MVYAINCNALRIRRDIARHGDIDCNQQRDFHVKGVGHAYHAANVAIFECTV